MIYKLLDILEDIDFGCEESDARQPVLAVALLEDADGRRTYFKMEDALFTGRQLKPGDRVYIDENGGLKKAERSTD